MLFNYLWINLCVKIYKWKKDILISRLYFCTHNWTSEINKNENGKAFRRPSGLNKRKIIREAMKKITPEREKRLQMKLKEKEEKIKLNEENEKSVINKSDEKDKKNILLSDISENNEEKKKSVLEEVIFKEKQWRRLRARPVAPLQRKHWIFIKNGLPLHIDDLNKSSASIFDEDDGNIEEKLNELKQVKEKDKLDANNENIPFWKRKQRKRKTDWEFPEEKAKIEIQNKYDKNNNKYEEIKNKYEEDENKYEENQNKYEENQNKYEENQNGNKYKKDTEKLLENDIIKQEINNDMCEYNNELISKWPIYKDGKRCINGDEKYGDKLINLMNLDISASSKMKKDIGPSKFIKAMTIINEKNNNNDSNNSNIEREKNVEEKISNELINIKTSIEEEKEKEEEKEEEEEEGKDINGKKEKYNSRRRRISGRNKNKNLEGMKDVGSRMISELKEKAIAYEQSGINPTYLKELKDCLEYYPGIEKQMRRKEMLRCNKTFEELLEEGIGSVENFNALIKSKALKCETEEALDIYNKMLLHGFEPNEDTFIGLIQNATAKKDSNMARIMFLRMRSRLITPTEKIYCALIKAHIVEGDIQSAFALLRKMEDENIKPDCVVYTALIDGLVKKNKIDRAWEVFRNMRTWKAIEPDEVLFTVMIKACAKRKEAEKALNMLDDLKFCGLYPTDITYTELIHACCLRKEFVHHCFDFYNQMKLEDMPVTTKLFEYLLTACATIGNIKRAKWVVTQMGLNEVPLNTHFYVILINIFASAMKLNNSTDYEKICNIRYTWHIIHDMKTKKVQITTNILNAVLQVYIKGGFTKYAIEMLPQYALFNCDVDRNTFFYLLKMLGQDLKDSGKFFSLWDYMKQNTKIKPDVRMLHIALSVAMDSRSAKTTIKILKDMYENKVYPSPKLADRLSRIGRQISEINELIGMFIKLQKEDVYDKNTKRQALIQTQIDEHELRLYQEGKTFKTPTIHQEEKEKYFKKIQPKKKKTMVTFRPIY